MDIANRYNEFGLPNNEAEDNNEVREELVTRIRSRRINKPHN